MLDYKKFKVNDKEFTKAYSTSGYYICSGNVLVPEAIFPSDEKHIFIQTHTPIKSVGESALLNKQLMQGIVETQLKARKNIYQTVEENTAYLQGYNQAKKDFMEAMRDK